MKTIKIISQPNGSALVTIRNRGKNLLRRAFPSIEKAMEFAVSAGNRQCQMYLNGYKTVPYGWVA